MGGYRTVRAGRPDCMDRTLRDRTGPDLVGRIA